MWAQRGRANDAGARKSDDFDELAEWVVPYLDELPRGERTGQRNYDARARRTEGAPRSSTFERHGGCEAVLSAAPAHRSGRS